MARKYPANEKIKLNYFEFLRQADGKSEPTIRQVERSLTRFEKSTRRAPFKSFDQKQAIAFKEVLSKQELSASTTLSTVQDVKRFFSWLAMQQGFKRAIRPTDIEYLKLSDKMARTAMQPAEKSYPSLQMIEKVVASMPYETPIEKRNRALIAFTAITGIRDGALVTLKIKHFDEERCLVLQNPNEVSTKFGKRIDTFLFPLNDEFEAIVFDWVRYLKNHELFASSDPLFPKTALGQGADQCFDHSRLSREHWANATPIRTIFKNAFLAAELPAFTPHKFRDMIVSEAYRRKLSIDELKAWSQNLGHEGMLTTLTSYGKIPTEVQGRLVRNSIKSPQVRQDSIDQIISQLQRIKGDPR